MSRSSRLVTAGLTVCLLVADTAVAAANWTSGSDPGGYASAAATTVDPGSRPVAVATRGDVTVTWPASTLGSGAAVDGYRISRTDDATATTPTTTGTCTGVVTATTCTETALPDGRWTYTVTPVIGTFWGGAESEPSVAVTTDSGLPANAITTAVLTGAALQDGTTVWYRGVAPGSFRLTNTLTDTSTGPESSATAAPAGDATGWSHAPSAVSLPTGGPFVSNPFSWIGGTTGTVDETVTGSDAAGNVDTDVLSFVDDSDPPTGGSISYPDGFQSDSEVTVTFTAATDAGSGLADARVQRSEAVLTDGACGAFTGFVDVGDAEPTSPVVDTGVAVGSCYAYRYAVTDRLGNTAEFESPAVVVVDPYAGGPPLRRAGPYSVLAVTSVVSTGLTTISGDVGVGSGGTVSGFPLGTIAGTTDIGNTRSAAALADFSAAYADAAGRPHDATFAGDLIGRTYTPGTYHAAAAIGLTGVLTLDGQGDPNSLFVFQVDAAFNTAALSRIVLENGAVASHVFWQVHGAAGFGAGAVVAGTVLADGAITLGLGARLTGRALSTGTVTLSDNAIAFSLAPPPSISIDGGPATWTRDVTPTVTGQTDAAPGRVVTVRVAGQTLTTVVSATGGWSVTASTLAAADHEVRASVRDADGNAGAANQLLTVEVNPAPVLLGTASTYSVLAGTGVVNTLATSLSGDLGLSPDGSITGFPPGTHGGAVHDRDSLAAQARADLTTAYLDAAGRAPSNTFLGDQIGQTYHEGVYATPDAFTLTGTLTLDAQDDPDAVFVIQVGGALDVAALGAVVLAHGAQASHVFWQVAGAVTTGADASMVGTLLCAGAITLGLGTLLAGRALSYGTVTLAADTVTG